MNVRVGDIIKLENNQFVAVSAALRQVWFQQGGWHTGTMGGCGATPTLLLCSSVTAQGGDIRDFQPEVALRLESWGHSGAMF